MYTLSLQPFTFKTQVDNFPERTVTNIYVSVLNENGSVLFFTTAYVNDNNQFEFVLSDVGEYFKLVNFLKSNNYCNIKKIKVNNYPNTLTHYYLTLTEKALLLAL